MAKRESTKQHWEAFWSDGRETGEIYSNDERIIGEALRARPMEGTRVLEVGAGTGRDTLALVEKGAAGVVLDYTMPALEITRRVAKENGQHIDLVCADAFNMPFREGSFGLVFHQGLLEHFRAPQQILTENARVLHPGGTLIVDVPQRYHAWTALKKVLIALDRWFAGWETQFSPRELEEMVEKERLVVTRTYGDFMVPGLAYRAVRTVLAKVGLRVLPLYPRGPQWWENGWESWRAWLKKQRWALYTCFVIGVVAEKPQAEGSGEATR